MRAAITVALALGLAGCSVANDVADQLARDRAKSVVNTVVAENLPGVDVAPVTDCIIDAASASEILDIAAASATGVTDATASNVLGIAQRPEAVECIASAALSSLLT